MMRCAVVLACVAVAAVAMADEKKVRPDGGVHERHGIAVRLLQEPGFSVKVDGTPFSHHSSLAVIDPSWTQSYYGYLSDDQRLKNTTTREGEGGALDIVMPLSSSRFDVVDGTQTLSLRPDRSLHVTTDLRRTSGTAMVIENRVVSLEEGWITNRPFTAVLENGETTSGRVTAWAPSTVVKESVVAQGFRRLEIDTVHGPLVIETTGPLTLSLVDYRRNEWAGGQRYFWLGVLGSPLPKDNEISYEVSFHFPEMRSAGAAEAVKADGQAVSVPDAYVVQAEENRIVPTPKQVKWADGRLAVEGAVLPAHVALSRDTHGEDEARLVKDARVVLEQMAGDRPDSRWSKLGAVPVKLVDDHADALLRVRVRDDFDLAEEWARDEAYRLKVDDDGIQIDACTTVGLSYALSTLEQLFRYDQTGGANLFLVQQVDVMDYPAMPFRGIHFFTGKDGRDIATKMVNEILGPLKLNQLVYQVDYLKWDSLPQIHSDVYGMDKSAARHVAEAARRFGMSIIPLVNTFGHSEWLLQRPSMRYLADDPENAYAYDPSNPEVYRICEEVYREAIELFQPTIVHIGHDEVSLEGFPRKPENREVGATQLFINDTLHYYEFLKKMGIRTMMWGDMLLGPGEAPDATLAETVEEARRRREVLPKDIIIADWHYKVAEVEEYKSLALLNEVGYETIACTWSAPNNILRFAKAAHEQHSAGNSTLGLMQTTWAGYTFDETSLRDSLTQYAAYVLAAEAAWTGGGTEVADVPFNHESEFWRRWNWNGLPGLQSKGWLMPLGDAATFSLDETGAGQLSLARDAFKGLKPGATNWNGVGLHLAGEGDVARAVMLAGRWSPEGTVGRALEVAVPAGSRVVRISMATPMSGPMRQAVGSVTLEAGGKRHRVDLQYGVNVMAIADRRQTLSAPIVWKSPEVEVDLGAAIVHVLEIDLDTVEGFAEAAGADGVKLTVESDVTGPGLMVFGMSSTAGR